MFAIRDDREYVNQEDLTKAARKVSDAKKHESEYISNICYSVLTVPQRNWSTRHNVDDSVQYNQALDIHHWIQR